MASATKQLNVKLSLDIKDFTNKLKIATGELAKSAKVMGDSLSSFGKKISTYITLPATIAVASFLKLASNQNEANDKLKAFYGESAPAMQKSLEAMGSALGRNATELKDYATNFGEVFSGVGLADEDSRKLSETLVQLGLDVASFRNVADEKVMDAFASAVLGQTRGLKQLGVNITETMIAEESMRLGLSQTGKELDERTKSLTIASLIQKKFSKDSGDLANSQGTFENSLKRFNSTLKNTGEILGQALIPFAIKLMNLLTPLIEGFGRLNETTKTIAISAVGIVAGLGAMAFVAGQILIAFNALYPVLVAVGTYIGGGLLGAISGIILPILAIGVAVISVIGAWDDLVEASKIIWEEITSIFKAGADWIISVWPEFFKISAEKIDSIFGTTVQFAKDFVVNIINALIVFPRWLANFLVGHVADSFNEIIGYLNEFESFTGMYFEPVTFTKFDEDVKITFEDLVDTAKWGFDNFKSAGIGAFKAVTDIAKKQWSIFTDNFSNGIDKIKGKLSTLFLTPEAPKGQTPERQSTFLTDVGAPATYDPDQDVPIVQAGLEKQKTLWDNFAEHVGTIAETIQQTMFSLYDSIAVGFGDAINSMIFDGAKFTDVIKSLMVDMAKQVISSLVRMAVQYVTNSLIGIATSKAQGLAQITTATATTYANTFSSISAIPIIGPALAPGIASANSAYMSATAIPMLALAEGGITQGPTNALIGEAGQEAVIPLDKLDSIMGSKEQIIMIHLDGRQIAKSVIKHAPREIRLNTGVIM